MYIDLGITVNVTGTSFTDNTVTGDYDEEGGAVRMNSSLTWNSRVSRVARSKATRPSYRPRRRSRAASQMGEPWPAKASVAS